MRIITFGEYDGSSILYSAGVSKLSKLAINNIVVSFHFPDDPLHNSAHLHMTPGEARKLAEELIVYAHKAENE